MKIMFTCLIAAVSCVAEQKPLVGFMGVAPEECSETAGFGATTVEIHGLSDAKSLRAGLDAAKEAGVSMLAKSGGRSTFCSKDGKIDFDRLEDLLDSCFPTNGVAGDEYFAGWWLVDEPAHTRKFDLEAEDLKRLYETVKRHNTRIPLAINFGDLGAYELFMKSAEPGWKFADIALFTITRKKLDRYGDYVARQAEIAKRIREFDPDVRIVPTVAVVEFKERKGELAKLPSAQWIETVSMDCIGRDVFSGILLYSYSNRPRWVGRNIADVKNDPVYADAFKRIFTVAQKAQGN